MDGPAGGGGDSSVRLGQPQAHTRSAGVTTRGTSEETATRAKGGTSCSRPLALSPFIFHRPVGGMDQSISRLKHLEIELIDARAWIDRDLVEDRLRDDRRRASPAGPYDT